MVLCLLSFSFELLCVRAAFEQLLVLVLVVVVVVVVVTSVLAGKLSLTCCARLNLGLLRFLLPLDVPRICLEPFEQIFDAREHLPELEDLVCCVSDRRVNVALHLKRGNCPRLELFLEGSNLVIAVEHIVCSFFGKL